MRCLLTIYSRTLTWDVACRMGLNLFNMRLNEMTPGLESKLPPTDTRWRQDLRAIEKGEYPQVCPSAIVRAQAECPGPHTPMKPTMHNTG